MKNLSQLYSSFWALVGKNRESAFFRNLATMMSGTLIAQVITIASIPILSRLFTPAQFGVFALFFTSVSIVGFVANGKFDNAIVLPDDDEKANNILRLCVFLSFTISLIMLIVVLVLPLKVYSQLNIAAVFPFRFLIPLGILIVSISQSFTYWNNRHKNYKRLATGKVSQSLATNTVNVGLGFGSPSVWGLISGFFAGTFLNLFLLLKKINFSLFKFQWKKKKSLMREYRNFPIFLAPMLLLNTFSINVLIYLLTYYFDQDTVGQYSQAYKVINYPLMFITASFPIVFYQKINEAKNKQQLYVKSVWASIAFGFIILLPVMLFGEAIFSFVLGSQWKIAGHMAAILCPLSIISFACTNVSDVFSVAKKNHILLIWQLVYLIAACSIIILMKPYGISAMLMVFSVVCSLLYCILILVGYFILKKEI